MLSATTVSTRATTSPRPSSTPNARVRATTQRIESSCRPDPPILPEAGRHRRRPSTSRTGSRSGSGWTCATTSRHPSSRTIPARRTATRTSSTEPTPTQADYIGHHPGTAFLELQFYPPGWVPFQNAISCDATQVVRGDGDLQLQQRPEHRRRQQRRLPEHGRASSPPNFAFITKSGHAPGAARPAGPHAARRSHPTRPRTCSWAPGDAIDISIHDSADGLVTEIGDLTTGESGSMTASIANGFAQVNYDPTRRDVHADAVRVPPDVLTSSEHTRVPWAAHSYNVAFSDEIGHFEYCDRGQPARHLRQPGGRRRQQEGRRRRRAASTRSASLRIQVGGCIATDNDFDGVSYQKTWPGSLDRTRGGRRPEPAVDPVLESDVQRRAELQPRRVRGRPAPHRGCRLRWHLQPDHRSRMLESAAGVELLSVLQHPGPTARLGCFWQLGGAHIPGHDQHLRWQLHRRVRSAAVPRLPRTGLHARSTARTTSGRSWPIPARGRNQIAASSMIAA